MKKILIINFFTIIFFVLNFNTVYSQVAVVVGKNSSNVVADDEIKKIFNGVVTSWKSGQKVKLLQQPDPEINNIFYTKFMSSTTNQNKAQILKLVLSGQIMAPIKCNSDDEIKKLLNSDNNTIGFINVTAVDASVKVLTTIK